MKSSILVCCQNFINPCDDIVYWLKQLSKISNVNIDSKHLNVNINNVTSFKHTRDTMYESLW